MDEFTLNLGDKAPVLDKDSAGTMFWPLSSYESISTLSLVPVTLVEFRRLASEMPVAFARSGDEIYPVALIGLPGLQNLVFCLPAPAALPLLLRAFPLAVGSRDPDGRQGVIISEPPRGDVEEGLPAFLPDGTMNTVLLAKTDALWFYVKARDDGATALSFLEAADAFEIWPLELVFEDGALPVSELLRVRGDFLQSEAYVEFLDKHGFDLATALHYHRISLGAIDKLASLEPLAMKSV